MFTGEIVDFLCKPSCIVDGARGQFIGPEDSISDSNTMVIVAKCRSLMDDSSAIFTSDIIVNYYPESTVFKLLPQVNTKN